MTLTVEPTPSFVLDAARAELQATKATPGARDLGVATALPGDASGRTFRVQNPAVDLNGQPAGELYVCGKGQQRIDVDELLSASHDEIVVRLKSTPAATPIHLFRRFDTTFVAKAFIEYLSSPTPAGMTHDLLSSQLKAASAVDVEGFNDLQQAAIGSIVEPGLSVVWGPPGTGKTRVIGAAVTRLVRSGLSVAIVSNTNIAVDQALLAAAASSEPFDPGTFVRVGHATLPEVAEHPSLTVRRVAAAKGANLIDRLSSLESQVQANRGAEQRSALSSLEAVLGDHEPTSLSNLISIRDGHARRQQTAIELERACEVVDRADEVGSIAEGLFDDARHEKSRLSPYEDLPDADRQAAALQAELRELQARGITAEENRDAAAAGPRHRRRKLVKNLEAELETLRRGAMDVESRLAPLVQRIDSCREAGVNARDVVDAIERERTTRLDWQSATAEQRQAQADAARLRAEFDDLESLPPLDDGGLRLIDLCDTHGSPTALLEHVETIRQAVSVLDAQQTALTAEIDELAEQLRQVEATVVSEAQVVGTTLAQLVLHHGLIEREFDYIIVDEASAALPVHVYTALTKGRVGASLIGDFEQNGPITNTKAAALAPGVRRWLHDDPFKLVGISSLESAQATPGCVALRDQYRFGPVTTALANRVAYKGLLQEASWAPPHSDADPEVILIDTSCLGEAARSEEGPNGKGRWWAAGAALSYQLAQRHGFAGVGVVSPYRLQAQLTQTRLREAGGGATQVGTAHAFQGREFHTVIVDLVEDGDGSSWVAQARRNGSQWALDGVRLFNVAVTRNAHRLYIITNIGAVNTAMTGPLAELRKMLTEDLIKVVGADEILGLPTAPTAATTTPFAPKPSELPTPVLFDSTTFYEQLDKDALESQDRVVIISPFVGRSRLTQISHVLGDLVSRGVTVRCVVTPGASPHDIALRGELAALGASVKEIPNFHEKVVIVDNWITYVGSLNVLSNTPKTSELMLRFEGRDSTRLIEKWMKDKLKGLPQVKRVPKPPPPNPSAGAAGPLPAGPDAAALPPTPLPRPATNEAVLALVVRPSSGTGPSRLVGAETMTDMDVDPMFWDHHLAAACCRLFDGAHEDGDMLIIFRGHCPPRGWVCDGSGPFGPATPEEVRTMLSRIAP